MAAERNEKWGLEGLKFNFNIYLNFISFSGWHFLLVEAVKYNSIALFGCIL